jgi:hypothetical protein
MPNLVTPVNFDLGNVDPGQLLGDGRHNEICITCAHDGKPLLIAGANRTCIHRARSSLAAVSEITVTEVKSRPENLPHERSDSKSTGASNRSTVRTKSSLPTLSKIESEYEELLALHVRTQSPILAAAGGGTHDTIRDLASRAQTNITGSAYEQSSGPEFVRDLVKLGLYDIHIVMDVSQGSQVCTIPENRYAHIKPRRDIFIRLVRAVLRFRGEVCVHFVNGEMNIRISDTDQAEGVLVQHVENDNTCLPTSNEIAPLLRHIHETQQSQRTGKPSLIITLMSYPPTHASSYMSDELAHFLLGIDDQRHFRFSEQCAFSFAQMTKSEDTARYLVKLRSMMALKHNISFSTRK